MSVQYTRFVRRSMASHLGLPVTLSLSLALLMGATAHAQIAPPVASRAQANAPRARSPAATIVDALGRKEAMMQSQIDQLKAQVETMAQTLDALKASKADKAQVDTLRNDFDHHWHIFQDIRDGTYLGTYVPGMYCHLNGKTAPTCSKTMSDSAQ